jgi:hypothetical protein
MGAGYALATNAQEADYIVRLEARPNMVVYDDGTEEQAPPEEGQFLLNLTLIRNEDGLEMVNFAFPFTEVEEMYDFNLRMVYEAMANVPITRLGDIEIIDISDQWRNKWLYLRFSFDYPVISLYRLLEITALYKEGTYPTPDSHQLQHWDFVFVGATIGAELQFLHWMSLEANFIVRFGMPEPEDLHAFIPGIGLQLKFPIKPDKHFMIEPYGMGYAMANTSGTEDTWYGAGGGIQFGVRGGRMGAFFIDINYLVNLGYVRTDNPRGNDYLPRYIDYQRHVISVGFGYKIGFFDRPPRRARE